MTSARPPRGGSENGWVVVFVAAGMTMLLSIAAMVIDLGGAYVRARELQNASDAAAMAGARRLDVLRLAGATSAAIAADVDATVMRIATRNGAPAVYVSCLLISSTGVPILPCSNSAGVAAADGVQVSTGAIKLVGFGKIVGMEQIRLDRLAAATIQPLIGQDAPLLVCAFGQVGIPLPPALLLPVLPLVVGGPTYLINPAAMSLDRGLTGPVYRAHAPHVADCGLQGSSFKGVAGTGPFMLPDWLPIATGVKAGPTRAQIVGEAGCDASYLLGCALLLPICSGSNGASGINGQMFCNLFGAFKLVAKTANTQDFRLLGRSEAIVGIGGDGAPGPNDVRLVRLIR